MLSMFSGYVTDLIFIPLIFLFHLVILISSAFNSWLMFLFYLIWTRFVSTTETVFNVIFRGQWFWVRFFVVYTFCWYFYLLCFHICSIILFLRFFSLLYLWCCCVYWFLWVLCDFDGWMFLLLIILCLLLMLLISLFLFMLLMLLIYILSPCI